jgi:hypothetical protein
MSTQTYMSSYPLVYCKTLKITQALVLVIISSCVLRNQHECLSCF